MKVSRNGEQTGGLHRTEFLTSRWFQAAAVAVALLLFVVSLVPFVCRAITRQELLLFFPGKESAQLYSERRLAPRLVFPRDRIEETVRQLIQGSVNMDPYPLFPYTTRINQVVVAENEIFIDLSPEAVATHLPIEETVEILKLNIRKNFSGYEAITVTVNGNDPVVVNKSLEEKDSEQ